MIRFEYNDSLESLADLKYLIERIGKAISAHDTPHEDMVTIAKEDLMEVWGIIEENIKALRGMHPFVCLADLMENVTYRLNHANTTFNGTRYYKGARIYMDDLIQELWFNVVKNLETFGYEVDIQQYTDNERYFEDIIVFTEPTEEEKKQAHEVYEEKQRIKGEKEEEERKIKDFAHKYQEYCDEKNSIGEEILEYVNWLELELQAHIIRK
ncbi:MAG: hypothetical protein P1Q69_06970 [Candidatus Thorarchaeota archaeon]|nr:hypothetical protein [Candidatus Thorarchaeota archaeon]